MSVKKLLVLSAASLAVMSATAGFAGGPDTMAMPAAPSASSIYIEAHGGYTQSDWNNFNSNNVMGTASSSVFDANSNQTGGGTGGADLGYNINQNIAIEGGWFYIPEVGGNGSGTSVGGITAVASSVSANISSWFAYGALKLSVPVVTDFDLFGKIGLAYRQQTYSSMPAALTNLGVTSTGHYWAPVFATGLQYNWNMWDVGAQYTYLPGNSNVNYQNASFGAPNAAPEVNMYTAFLGYKFEV